MFDGDVGCARYRDHGLLDRRTERDERVEIVTEDFNGKLRAHTGKQLIEPHLNRLQKLVAVAGNRRDDSLEIGNDIGLGFTRVWPFRARLEHDEVIGNARRHGISGDLGRADLREHGLDLGHLAYFGF